MIWIAKLFVGLVALEHLYIFYMESFAWTTLGKKVFRGAMPDDMFEKTKVLAANQGVYNAFLAAGLIWSLLISDPIWSKYIAIFFLACVMMAGLVGAGTASRKILYTQFMPAFLAFLLVLFLS